jgi:hypothetical protein
VAATAAEAIPAAEAITAAEAIPAAVLRWAASVWAAWSSHHDAIRDRTTEVASRRG